MAPSFNVTFQADNVTTDKYVGTVRVIQYLTTPPMASANFMTYASNMAADASPAISLRSSTCTGRVKWGSVIIGSIPACRIATATAL